MGNIKYHDKHSDIKLLIKYIKLQTELQSNIDDIHKAICGPPCIELRDINYEQARKEIELFFKENHGKEYYPSDLMEMLGIDFRLAARICNDLETEWKIQSNIDEVENAIKRLEKAMI